ncbi:uncharacterized protein TM35_000361150 [Trypanosoma theileri]|uniref:Uncharacterized protein n=1 Tax=Trypanosoma theileri TaxID=67003 RepID=A0A1X0NKJ7_9TRYP|nr:uncharacterized protein TM35_000361150 [Trypanosoma theileri]ORC85255.1 hypothetical protein TM35_000361150 [Trypanosoma theileri]
MRGSLKTSTGHGMIFGPLDHNTQQTSPPYIIDVGYLEKRTLPESVKQDSCATFKGHSILQKSNRTPVATKEEELLPLQQIDVGMLSTKWIRKRLNNSARRRWDEVWNIMQTYGTHLMHRKTNLRINNAKAQRMKESEIICTASSHPSAGRVVPFTVEEEKLPGKRRLFIAWLKKRRPRMIMRLMFL